MVEHGLLSRAGVANAARRVWTERNQASPPGVFPALPDSWPDRYEHLAADHDLETATFPAAVLLVETLWTSMFADERR